MTNWHATALLPTGTKINPVTPSLAEYFDPEATMLVLERLPYGPGKAGSRVVATTFGPMSGHKLGETFEVRHDQTLRNLGEFKIIGMRFGNTAQCAGELPDQKLPHWVFK
jgi:hypothetical protein